MQKISFCERYMLTTAVLNRTKELTRRLEKALERAVAEYEKQYGEPFEIISQYWDEKRKKVCCLTKYGIIHVGTHYQLNEVVAVAQAYMDAGIDPHYLMFATVKEKFSCVEKEIKAMDTKGWSNKLFVRADLMPHQIQITDINIVRLQDISEEDCLKEGIKKKQDWHHRKPTNPFFFGTPKHSWEKSFPTAKKAFATLINRPGVGRKGLWEENPFVFAYSFKLIK